jgi:hypothetical protein
MMDTDELSSEVYKGIIVEAETFNHDLALQFGVLASSCKNEKEYFQQSKDLIMEIRGLKKSDLSELFFVSPPAKKDLFLTLKKILTNISEVEKIPEDKRNYEF